MKALRQLRQLATKPAAARGEHGHSPPLTGAKTRTKLHNSKRLVPRLLWRKFLVAGDRYGQNGRQGEPNVISLGTWQISMVRAVQKYINVAAHPAAANDGRASVPNTFEA